MVKTSVTEGKAKLSKLVERASRGHDVLITVRGKVKARLTKAEEAKPRKFTKEENEQWMRERIAMLRKTASDRKPTNTPQEWWDELRADRF